MSEFRGLKRRQVPAADAVSLDCPPPPDDWPWESLWAFLTWTRWEDSSPRRPGTLLFFSEAGRLKACLSDRDAEAVAFVTLTGSGAVLDELEGLLAADDLDWRASTARSRAKPR